MKSSPVYRQTGAFTLIEMLCVVSIIGILAALLLPVLAQGKAQAKSAWCGSNLHQLGLAFQSFSHDHDDLYPWQVSVLDGGTGGAGQDTNDLDGQTTISAATFQAMADDLGTPKILICPTDSRPPAVNFNTLQNYNLSYFTGENADYYEPESVLAGDRNLAPGSGQTAADGTQDFWWTKSMHHFRGNLLYSDGHVVLVKGFQLASRRQIISPVVEVVKTHGLSTEESGALTSLLSNSGLGLPAAVLGPLVSSPDAANFAPPATPNNGNHFPSGQNSENPSTPSPADSAAARTVATDTLGDGESDAVSHAHVRTSPSVTPVDDASDMSFFDHRVGKTTGMYFALGYSLLLLLELAWLSYRVWRRLHQDTGQPERN